MKLLIALFISATLTSCIIVPINEDSLIKTAINHIQDNCNFIKTVTYTGSMDWAITYDIGRDKNKVKNNTATARANDNMVTSMKSDISSSRIIIVTLICEY